MSSQHLDEIEEMYETVNEDKDEEGLDFDSNSDINLEEDEKENIITDLKNKIARLEKTNKELRFKNEDLTKNNNQNNSVMTRMSLVGTRRKFTSQGDFNQVKNDTVKLAEIIKEKDDLQEMNEKMLDLLTDKELENEELMQQLENYKLEAAQEKENNLLEIQNLKEKVTMLENSKGANPNFDIDDIINEYNNYKERLKNQIKEYSKNEEDLKQQLDMKERTINRLKEDIQGLELENLQLMNNSENNDRMKEKGILEIETLKSENEHIKRDMGYLEEKLKLAEENYQKLSKSHENEINDYQKRIENEQKNLKNTKEEKNKEINALKSDINKFTHDIDIFSKKIEIVEKKLDDEKQKNFMVQNKLDKKKTELQDLKSYTQKLLTNKENLLSQYEGKIEEITKDKNDLLSQNKELLEKLKAKSEEGGSSRRGSTGEGTNLSEIIKEDEENNNEEFKHFIQENKLLKEEIKQLKEQLNTQAKDLVDLNSLDKEIEKLKALNETLFNDNKTLKKKLEEGRKRGDDDNFPKKTVTFKLGKKKKPQPLPKRGTMFVANMDKVVYEKQLNAFKKIKEEEKKDYEHKIEKVRMELATLKVKFSNYQFESDTLLAKYKNTLKSISTQCKKNGIKLSLNLVNLH